MITDDSVTYCRLCGRDRDVRNYHDSGMDMWVYEFHDLCDCMKEDEKEVSLERYIQHSKSGTKCNAITGVRSGF